MVAAAASTGTPARAAACAQAMRGPVGSRARTGTAREGLEVARLRPRFLLLGVDGGLAERRRHHARLVTVAAIVAARGRAVVAAAHGHAGGGNRFRSWRRCPREVDRTESVAQSL